MTVVGRVAGIWRYPVKSMRGESLEACDLDALGVPGDRGWAVRDERSGEIRGAKKFPILMTCEARYCSEPRLAEIPPAEIKLPNGEVVRSDAAGVDQQLSQLLETPVRLFPRQPAQDQEHYRRRVPLSESELRDLLGREPDDVLPDLSIIPDDVLREISEFTSPRGTYFDAYPIHLITTSWIDALKASSPTSRFEAPRFRPNFLIEGAAPGLAELQ